MIFFFFQAEDGIRDLVRSRGLGDVYKRQHWRASRMLLILSFLWVVLYALLSRLLLNRWFLKSWIIGSDYKKNILVIGDIIQIQKVNSLLSSNRQSFDLLTKDPNELDFYDREQWTDFIRTVSYTHLRAHETVLDLVCRLLLEKKTKKKTHNKQKKKRN